MEKNTNTTPKTYPVKGLTLAYFGLILMALMYSVLSNTHLPDNRDLINHLVLIFNASHALAAGQFPLRYIESTQQFLYPIFQFYSSTSYTLSGLLSFLLPAHNPLLTYKVMTGLALWLSAYSMYYLLNTLFRDKLAAITGSAIYLTAPYMIILTNQFYSFNEVMALCLLPSVIYYTLQRYNQPQDKILFLKMSLAWYLLITIHLVTFFYFTLLFSSFLVAFTLSAKQRSQQLLACISAIGLALLVSAWYWIPVVMFEKYLVIHSSFQNIFDPGSKATLKQLLAFSPFHLANNGNIAALNPALGWPLVLGVCGYIILYFKRANLGTTQGYRFLPYFLALFTVTILVMLLSSAVWQFLPDAFRVAQYSWRLLSQATWLGAILATGVISFIIKNMLHGRKIALGFLGFILLMTCLSVRHTSPTVSLSSVLDHPNLRYGQTNYLIDNPQFISAIDNVNLSPLVDNHILQVDKTYHLTQALWQAAKSPYVLMTGQFNAASKHQSVTLLALLDGKKIATLKVNRGKFTWNIPLDRAHFSASKKSLTLQFVYKNKSTTSDLRIDTLAMKGFLPDTNLLSLDSQDMSCTSEKGVTHCQFKASNATNWVELPAYYYPHLYRVLLNDQPITYQAILKDGKSIMAIHPEHSGHNQVSLSFVGISWANRISFMGILLALMILIPSKKKELESEPQTASSLKVRIKFVYKT